MTDRAAVSARRVTLDKVGILIGVLTIVAVFGLPFMVLRPNRIAAGTGPARRNHRVARGNAGRACDMSTTTAHR